MENVPVEKNSVVPLKIAFAFFCFTLLYRILFQSVIILSGLPVSMPGGADFRTTILQLASLALLIVAIFVSMVAIIITGIALMKSRMRSKSAVPQKPVSADPSLIRWSLALLIIAALTIFASSYLKDQLSKQALQLRRNMVAASCKPGEGVVDNYVMAKYDSGPYVCARRAADAGKNCSDGKECDAGICLASMTENIGPPGTCAEFMGTSEFCLDVFKDGQRQQPPCIST